MNSEFTNKLNRLRELLSEHTSAQDFGPGGGPGGDVIADPEGPEICPKDEMGACCGTEGCSPGQTQADCEKNGGIWHQDTPCEPSPCQELAVEKQTNIKSRDDLLNEFINGPAQDMIDPMQDAPDMMVG